MSLDLSLVNAAGDCFDRNMTHNVAPMWRKAGVYEAFYESDGHRAAEYIEALRNGLCHFVEHYPEYELLNAKNGWGLAEIALPWLFDAYRAFAANPDAIIRVSR